MTLRERVSSILGPPRDSAEERRVHLAIETVADEVDRATRRLAVIDPEWELIARQPIEGPDAG